MMRTIRVALLTAALFGAPVAAAPASAQEPVVITFEEAIGIALEQSIALERAENAVVLDALSVSQARWQFAPSLSLSTSGSRDYGRSFSQEEGRVLTETNQSVNARLSSSVIVFDGLTNVANLRAARLEEEAGLYEYERARQDVVFSVISGFLTLIAAEEQVEVQAENLAAQAQQEQQVELLVQGGRRPISDLYQQQANVAAARASLVEAERSAELAEIDLVQALRLDPVREYAFAAPSLPDADTLSAAPNAAELLERALERRPDLAALRSRVASAEEGVDAAQGGRWPSVSLSAGYGSAYSSTSDLSFNDQLDQRQGGSVGLNVSVPLFDRGTVSRDVQRAEVQQDNARLALTELRQQVAFEVRRALLDRAAAVERLAAAVAREEAARRALEATENRYRAGVATLLEVTQSRAELVAAVSAAVNARYTLLFQEELLEYYAGDLDAGAATMGADAP